MENPLSIGDNNKMYVADMVNNRIQRFDTSEEFVEIITEKKPSLEKYSNPSGIAIDNNENLYVADTYNYRIQRIEPDRNITVIGTNGSGHRRVLSTKRSYCR